MHIIRHPQTYMTGTRVLMLKARHKDGIEAERQVLRISHTREQFGHRLAELSELSRPGERIYAPASPRLMRAAIRLFKERQLAADYDADPEAFYRNIEGRWCSCLMDPRVQDGKLWLIDCDSEGDRERAETELAGHYDREMPPYQAVELLAC